MNLTFSNYNNSKHRNDLLELIKILQEFEIQLDPDLAPPTQRYCEETIDGIVEQCNSKQGQIIVAIDDQKPVGFVSLWQENDPSLYADDYKWYSIEAMVIKPSYRRKGIATSLLKEAEKFATNSGIKQLRINVLAANQAALAVYQHCGFTTFEISLKKNL